jgi:hypothetical protein
MLMPALHGRGSMHMIDRIENKKSYNNPTIILQYLQQSHRNPAAILQQFGSHANQSFNFSKPSLLKS